MTERAKTGRANLNARAWRAVLGAVALILYAPVLMVVVLSFNSSRYGTLPFEFTLQWYERLFQDSQLFVAVARSALLALVVSLTACIVGVTAGLWLARYARRSLVPLTGSLTGAVTIPWLILSVALLLLANGLGSGRSLGLLFFGSLVVVAPYVAFLVLTRLQGMGTNLEDAAASLGASRAVIFLRVTFPQIWRAALSGGLFAFVITFNNFPVQYFLAPFGFTTLPLEIYTMVRSGYEPNINALATLIICLCVLGGLVGTVVSRYVGRRARKDERTTPLPIAPTAPN